MDVRLSGKKALGCTDKPSVTSVSVTHAVKHRGSSGGYGQEYYRCSNWIAALPEGLL